MRAPGTAGPHPSYVYTESSRFDPEAWTHAGERFPEGAALRLVAGGNKRALVAGFFATADAEVSFDGRRVLFAGKQRREEGWQIWEAPLEGGPPRQITRFEEDCIRPLYLPEDRVVYARKRAGAFQLEALALAGGAPLLLTYAPGDYLPCQVLRDGRILFEGPHPIGSSGPTELYTVYSDGSGVEAVRCDHGRMRRDGRQVASGDLVFVTGKGFGSFTPARARQIDLRSPEGELSGPIAELEPGRWLISWKPRAGGSFALYEWAPSGASQPVPVAAWPAGALQPVLVQPRNIPRRHPSALHDREGANLLCLNSYESPIPIGAGSVASMKLYSQSAAGKTVLLGQAKVEDDGSFYAHVPAGRPLRIELADRSGRVLAAEKGWFWMRRGEQRVCVGCHAGPERSPENAVPKALLHSTIPVDLTKSSGGKP